MKQSELVADKAYTNGSESKWYQVRTITKVEDGLIYFKVTAGRDPGRTGSMKIASFAQWAEKEL